LTLQKYLKHIELVGLPQCDSPTSNAAALHNRNGPAIAEPFQFSANPIIPKGRLLINIKGVIFS
jgi:hypothetical protein